MVLPIGPLMIEHRLIEKMISVMKKKIEQIRKEKIVDTKFIDTAVDFIQTYADQCHHGKEEKIMFRELKKKKLGLTDKRIMDELIDEHIQGRNMTRKLVAAKAKYEAGERIALEEIVDIMQQLAEFYPKHIEKEDKVFFKSSMKYLTKEEKDAMLKEEREFDMGFIHTVYKNIVFQSEQMVK